MSRTKKLRYVKNVKQRYVKNVNQRYVKEKFSLKKNDLTELTIEDLSSEGFGIGHAQGMAVFVKDAVPGDRVRARIVKPKKNYAYARLEEILTPGPDRVEAVCPVARRCGGCQIQEMSYPAQLRWKERKVRENLIRIGGFQFDAEEADNCTFYPILGMEDPWHYRNKAQYPVGEDKDGRIVAGFYAGRTHSIIDNHRCEIGIEENEAILEAVLSWMKECKIAPYHEETGTGCIRHVMIRAGFSTGELMVVIVAAASRLKDEKKLVERLLEKTSPGGLSEGETMSRELSPGQTMSHELSPGQTMSHELSPGQTMPHELSPGQTMPWELSPGQTMPWEDSSGKGTVRCSRQRYRIKSIILNTNLEKTNVILGHKNRTLYGEDWIEDRIGSLRYRISAQSFYQVNPMQTAILYQTALEYAALKGNETVWDLYCGTGTISLFLAQKAGRVIGVEVIPEAIENAKQNAILNHIGNCEFIAGKAEELTPSLPPADVIVVDPPRKGLDRIVIETILLARPDRIVYVSCDSATLARDLALLTQGGYNLRKVQPVDQFCHTVHVETVCLLSKLSEAKNHISVKVDMDEMDVTAAESKATYQEIQDWVKEKYGFHVSHLNIAKTKRKCGIIERQNYNHPKIEDSRSPETPKEKEKAIIEAFKAFQMI